jgi:hypothetical protein
MVEIHTRPLPVQRAFIMAAVVQGQKHPPTTKPNRYRGMMEEMGTPTRFIVQAAAAVMER